MKIILVTGGTGFIGSHTCIALLDKGFNIFVVDSLVNSSKEVIEKLRKISFLSREATNKIEFKKGDLRDEIFLDNLFYELKKNKVEIEAVIHFAGLKAVGESEVERHSRTVGPDISKKVGLRCNSVWFCFVLFNGIRLDLHP